jgi:protein-tyrosine-phosphatase
MELRPASAPRSLSRRFVLAAAAGIAIAPQTLRAACPPPRVLFVCPVGTVKSAIARESLKAEARRRGLAVAVRSRGLQPEDHLTPALAASLAADGIDPKTEPVRALTVEDVRQADILVAFDEAADDPRLKGARVWNVPSFVRDYPAAKPALDAHIAALLDELAQRERAGCPGQSDASGVEG